MPDDKKSFSLVDWASSEVKQSDTPSITNTLLGNLSSILNAREEEKQKNKEQLPVGTKVNFDNNTLTYDVALPYKDNVPAYEPVNNFNELIRQLDNPVEFSKRLETQRKQDKILKKRQEIGQQVKDIGSTSKVINALKNGIFYQGAEQNLQLLTGVDDISFDSFNPYKLTIPQLDDLRNSGIITTEDYKNYLNNRNQLPLLTSISASLLNSLLIAAEIGATAPKTAFSVAEQSAKFFSKEGLKLYGKQMGVEALNSWRVMGPGANIKAARESADEIKNTPGISVPEALGIIGKNIFTRNMQAAAEGWTEATLRDFRYANVTLASLMGKEGWQALATNLGKKSISGLLFESATEQITDVMQDMIDGTKSSMLNIFDKDPKVQRGAVENLFTEAITGLLLGTAMGGRDIFRADLEKEIVHNVKEGKITAEVGQKILDAREDQQVINNALNIIRNKNTRATWSQTAKSVAHGLNTFTNFGVKDDPGIKVHESEQATHIQSLVASNDQFVNNLATVSKRIDDEQKRTGVQANTLDQAIMLGQENVTSYLNTKGDIEHLDYVGPFKKDDPTYNLPFELLHGITEKMTSDIMAATGAKGVMKDLNIPSNLSNKQQQELKQDLTVASVLGFENKGFDLIKSKWSKVLDKETLNSLVDNAKGQQTQRNRAIGAAAAQEAFSRSVKDINDYYGSKALADADNKVKDIDREREEINSISDNIPEVLNEATGYHGGPQGELPIKKENTITLYRGLKRIEDVQDAIETQSIKNLGKEEGIIGDTYLTEDLSLAKMYAGEKGGVIKVTIPESEIKNLRMTGEGDIFIPNEQVGVGDRYKPEKIKIEEHKMFQRPQNTTTDSLFPSYEDVFKEFKGETVGELFKFLEDNHLMEEALLPVYKLLLKHIKDVKVTFKELIDDGKQYPGQYLRAFENQGVQEVIINPKYIGNSIFAPGHTALHEALHAFTADFLASNTKEALEFRSDIDAIIKDLRDVLNNPEQAIKNGVWMGNANDLRVAIATSQKDITYYIKSAEEFIAGVFADTTKVRGLLMRISSSASRPTELVTAWDKVRNAFKKAWNQILPSDKSTLFDSLIDVMSKHQENLESSARNRQRQLGLTTQEVKKMRDVMSSFASDEPGLVGVEDIKEDAVEANQEDDDSIEEKILDASSTKGFVSLLAELTDLSIPEMRKSIKAMGSREAFKVWLDQQDKKYRGLVTKRLDELFDSTYKHKQEDKDKFRDRFITGTFNSINNTKSMPHVMVQTNRTFNTKTKSQDITTSIVKLGDTFKNGDGSTADSYVETTILESFIEPVESFLGLPKGTLQLQYIAGFESQRDDKFEQRSTLKDLTKWILGNKDYKYPKSQLLAEIMWKNGYIYLGNFGGRNTSPVLFIPEQSRTAVKDVLDKVAEQYGATYLSDSRVGHSLRLLLEDMWLGAQFKSINEIKGNSQVLKENINKVWKRGMKFLTTINSTWQNTEHLNNLIGKKPLHGIAIKDGEITLRTTVFNSNDNGTITLNVGNESIVIPIKDLLINSRGTERSDGASFYLLGELDEIYHNIHGTLKDGTIKNVYSASYGEKALYIKHAMHGIHPSSPLGVFMRKHNIALLVSDTAAKVKATEPINISALENSMEQTIPKEQIMELQLSKFQRIKEELGVNTIAGTIKQWLNGSGHGTYSSVIKASDEDGKYDEHLRNLAERMTTEAQKELLSQTSPKALYKVFKSMVDQPGSPKEEIISQTFKSLSRLPQDEFFNRFGNVLNHPMVAESLRQRLFRTISMSLQARIGGMRLTLRPDMGILNANAGSDLVENSSNIDKLLVNLAKEEGILSEVFPETGLGDLAVKYLDLQRAESMAITRNEFDKVKSLRADKEKVVDDIIAIGKAGGTTKERAKLFATGNIYNLIDKTNDKVNKWREKQSAKILSPVTKHLTEDWAVIPEDLANTFGLKPGDTFIAIVTPTDSPLGIVALRVGAIAPVFKGKDSNRKVADRMSIMLNSEYIQSIVGKDFDIDTISLVPSDPHYWTKEQYNAVWNTIKTARNKFVDKVTRTTQRELKDNNITKEAAFTGNIREKFMQSVMGKKDVVGFDAQDKFWDLNDAYLVDPSGIITERLYHTALSAIDFKTKLFGRILAVNNPGWFRTHLAHLIDTNFSVDFPGQISKLTYTGPEDEAYKKIMYTLRYGDENVQDDEVIVSDKVIKFLFSTAFDLAAGRDLSFGSKPDFNRLKGQIIKQQTLLRLIDEKQLGILTDLFNNSLDTDLESVEKLYGNTHPSYEAAVIKNNTYKEIAAEFIGNMETKGILAYPLFAGIMAIDTNNMPMPGSTYEDWLIDQNLLAKDLIDSNANIAQIFRAQVLDNPYHRGTLKQDTRNFITSMAWNIIKYTGTIIPKNSTAVDTLDKIQINKEATEELLSKVGSKNYGKLKAMLQEYSSLRSLVGQPYPVDAIRDGQDWAITHQAIALSLLPQEMDFAAKPKRSPLDLENNLNGVQNEIISILHAFKEVKTPGYMASDTLRGYRHGREVSFPMLMKLIFSKPRVTAEELDGGITLKLGNANVVMKSNSKHQLTFEFSGETYTQDQLVKATEGPAAQLYHALTERGGIFEGVEDGSNGVTNRIELSKLINFNNNTKPEERLELLINHIQSRLYSDKSKFSNTDRQALWISFIAQATNAAIRDSKVQGLNIRKDAYNPQDALNYRANEILYRLLSRFEPGLFNRVMASYNDITARMSRIDQEIGIQATRRSSLAIPDMLMQPVFDESHAPTRNNKVFDLVVDEIHELAQKSSYHEFNSIIKEKGFDGGLNYLRTMINNTQIKHALASSDIWFGDLVRDIKRATPEQLNEKYGPKAAEKIHNIIKMEALNIPQTDNFLQQNVIERGGDVAALKAIWLQLKGIEEISNKVNSGLTGVFKKMLYGKLSYNLVAPLKEKKIYAFSDKNTVIGQLFAFEGTRDMTLQDMESFNKSYATTQYQGIGESSISIRKSAEINLTLNRYHAELSGSIASMENLFKLLLNEPSAVLRQKPRDLYMSSEAVSENIPRVELIKSAISQLGPIDTDLLLLRKEIFNLAENLKDKTGVEIVLDDLGRIVYRRGDYFSFDKYDFIKGITSPQVITDEEGKTKVAYPEMQPLEKIKLLAALDVRELYDVKVPQLLKKALGYIERARLDLVALNDVDAIIQLDALRDRYLEYLDAIVKHTGTYVPHMFATETYKFLWATKYRTQIVKKLKAEYPNMDYNSKEFGELVMKAVDSAFSDATVGESSAYTIPNFLPRRNPEDDSYKKATLDMHFQYIGQLITGLKHDLLFTDHLTYQSKARANGERNIIMELSRMWYADQIRNKMLHTKDVANEDITRGMQINFLQKGFVYSSDTMLPIDGNLEVWGIVDKVNKKDGTITLKIDKDRVKFDLDRDLDKAKEILSKISSERSDEPASNRQVFTIKSLVKKGYLKPEDIPARLDQLTKGQALQATVTGYERLKKNIDQLGVYKISDLYSEDINGAHQPKVKRYTRRGSLDWLATKRREADNLRNHIGEWDNKIDKYHYNAWKVATWGGNMLSVVPKTIMAMMTMGMIVGPNAWFTNKFGAMFSNHFDAPITSFGYRFAGNKEWGGFQAKSRDTMNASQKRWYDIFSALGLTTTKDLVAISLEAGNINLLDVLADKGFWGGLTYLVAAVRTGGEYHQYLEDQDNLRRQYLLTDDEHQRELLANKMRNETDIWKAKIEQRIKSYTATLTPTAEDIAAQRKLNPGVDEATLREYARGQRIIDAQAQRAKEIEQEKEAGTFNEVTNVAVEEQMDRAKSTKVLGKFLMHHFLTGYFGLGLQATAESERRPAFKIGQAQAEDLGYSKEEALWYGVASVEYRHAFYGPAFKQFDANTKFGAFLQMYVQYSYNNAVRWFFNMKQALPQLIMQWERDKAGDVGFVKRVWHAMFNRTITNMTSKDTEMASRNPDKAFAALQDVNITHRLLAKHTLNMIVNQLGSRLFYGITGWTDPMVQLFHKFIDTISDRALYPGDDDDDWWDTIGQITEAFFFLGLPYKLLMQYLVKQPDENLKDVYLKGRIEDQFEFFERLQNEINLMTGEETPLIQKSMHKKRFWDYKWLIDDVAIGAKILGDANPKSQSKMYQKWGYSPSIDLKPPFIHLTHEAQMIKIKNRAPWVDTPGWVDFGERMNQVFNPVHTFNNLILGVDKLNSNYKPTK